MGAVPGKTWVGLATQSKLFFGVAGWTEWEGTMFRLDDPTNVMCTFESRARHLGIGAAAGSSAHMMFFFNTGNIAKLEGKSFGNGADLTIGIPPFKLLKLAMHAQNAIKIGKGLWDVQGMLSIANDAASGLTTREPTVVSIPIPGVDGIMGISRSEAFQGTIDIKRFVTRHGALMDV
jgi:hypothetical protein